MLRPWTLALLVVGSLLIATPSFARVWRDQKGNLINADFVKVEGGMIYLKPENKYAAPTPFPFYDFSEADQEFVKNILAKKGQLDRVPPPPPKQERNGTGPANAGNALPVTVVPNTAPAAAGTIPDIPDTDSRPGSKVPIAVVPTVPPTFNPPATASNSPVSSSQVPASSGQIRSDPFGGSSSQGAQGFPRPAPQPVARSRSAAIADEFSKAVNAPAPDTFEDKFLAATSGQRLIGIILLIGGVFSIWGSATDNDWFFSFGKSRGFVSLFGRNGARLFYGILGTGLAILGTLVLLGIVVLKNSR